MFLSVSFVFFLQRKVENLIIMIINLTFKANEAMRHDARLRHVTLTWLLLLLLYVVVYVTRQS